MNEIAIVVHGGAGAWDIRAPRMNEAEAACQAAALAGQQLLLSGGTALDAVEKAVNILEDCPVLDAGIGSYLNLDGNIEMDAFIMDGATLDMGALAAVQRVRYPVSLARKLMELSEHAVLAGEGASRFADAIGFPRCELEDLLVDGEWQQLSDIKTRKDYQTVEIFTEPGSMDTVGAVAIDQHGNIAAATSTGGTRGKLPGRVGDSPLVGSGGYADNLTAGVSSTGHGESLMKVVISKRVCDLIERGLNVGAACAQAIDELDRRVNGVGGLIAISHSAEIGISFNTSAMPHAFGIENRPIVSGTTESALKKG